MPKPKTKAEMQRRIAELETALSQLLASHRDFMDAARRSSYPDLGWSQRIEDEVDRVLWQGRP